MIVLKKDDVELDSRYFGYSSLASYNYCIELEHWIRSVKSDNMFFFTFSLAVVLLSGFFSVRAVHDSYVALCLIVAAGAFLVVLLLNKLRKDLRRLDLELHRDPIYKRSRDLKNAYGAFFLHVECYKSLYNAYCHGKAINEDQVERYVHFLKSARASLLRLASNLELAISLSKIDSNVTDREKLIEMMAVLNRSSDDPIAELTDGRAESVLDTEESLVEVMHELNTLQLST